MNIKIHKDTYWLDVDQLLIVFPDIPNRHELYRRISRGTFPVKTFKVGKRRYADREAVRAFFRQMREEAIQELNQ